MTAMFAACRGSPDARSEDSIGKNSEIEDAIMRVEKMSFPFECESPFLFAVYHLDRPRAALEMSKRSTFSII